LFLRVPDTIKVKLAQFSKNENLLKDRVELIVLFGLNAQRVRNEISRIGGTFEDLGYGFGIINVGVRDLERVFSIKEIQYIELPKTLYTTYLPSNRAACIEEVWSLYNLSGQGVLVGFIDSGIDFTHPAFKDQAGNTRIDYINDLSLGRQWNRDEINAALKSPNPFDAIPQRDTIGHGTHVAGIACAGGRIDRRYYGAAYNANIAMVKMTAPGSVNYAQSTQLMRGIKSLIDKAAQLNKPLVINLSFSTNDGAHDGSSLLEQYISTIARLERISFVTAAGNEGAAGHHVGGALRQQQTISVSVASQETSIILQLYKNLLEQISIEIRNPAGVSTGVIRIREGFLEGSIGTDRYFIYDTGPKPISINGETIISFVSGSNVLASGDWTITINLESGPGLQYDIWMPIAESLAKETRFLQPNPFNTLGIPATVNNVISVGSYNYNTNTISVFSGRGRQGGNPIKPDIVAPGEEIEAPIPGGRYDALSGTSMASPHLAGSCALMMEWGIVKGNDPFLFGDRLKYFLLRTARRTRPNVVYPDPAWGYGELCLRSAMDLVTGATPRDMRQIPQEILNLLQSSSPSQGQQGPEEQILQAGQGQQMVKPQAPSQNQMELQQISETQQQIIQQPQGQAAQQLPPQQSQTQNVQQTPPQGQQIIQTQQQVPQLITPQMLQDQTISTSPAQGTCGDLYINENYENFLVQYQGDIVRALQGVQNACAFILDDNFAVVSVERSQSQQILRNTREIVYVGDPTVYTLSALNPIQTANIYKFHDSPFLTLRGQGVLIGILDTGIDYMNQEFMYENDTTRVLRLWDQTITGGRPPQDFNFGVEFSSEDINRAIASGRNGGDPYAIVGSRDELGHGTAMAGIIGARGRNPDLRGAAPDSEFVVVKMKTARRSTLETQDIEEAQVPVYDNTDVILALKYLHTAARRLQRPMVIYVPVSTNRGAHDGSSIIERYIDEIAQTRGIAIVTGTGNEGDTDTHTTGTITRTGDMKTIELRVDEGQGSLAFLIWLHKPDRVSVGVVSPTGEIIERIPAKLQQTEQVDFVFEGTNMLVQYFVPEEVTGDVMIRITMTNVKGGIWQFRLYGDYIVDGNYDAWLPQRVLLKENTRFLNPSQFTTLTIPSTSREIISIAYYNQDNNSIVVSSGRGFTRDGRIKPDIAAGGINVTTTAVGGGTTTVTGSSVGAAVAAGAVALLLEWGIVKGRDTTMYSRKIQTYLIRGAAKRTGDIYPNRQWGYGMLDLNGVFENIRGLEEWQREEEKKSRLFIRIPDEIKRALNLD
jgi:subtilisin family serine protease